MASTLKLKMEKGPRSGETLEFNPKMTIRLGRVLRGNNLPIKDPGISSKHLKIEFDSDSSNWVISDLDSSNGTLLNDLKLNPLDSVVVSDGDVIKIGEVTLIRVEFGGADCRRNPRRGVAPPSVELKVEEAVEKVQSKRNAAKVRVAEAEEVRDEVPPKPNAAEVKIAEEVTVRVGDEVPPKPIAASVKVEVVEEEEEDVRVLGERNAEELERGLGQERGLGRPKKGGVLKEEREERRMGTRRTRRGEVELLSLEDVVPARRTRSAKNVVKIDVVEEKVLEGGEEVENVSVVEKKTRKGRSVRKKVVESNVVKSSVVDMVPEGKGFDLDEDGCEETENARVVEKKMTRGRSVRKKAVESNVMKSNVVEKLPEGEGLDLDEGGCEEVENVGVVEEKRVRGGSVRKKVLDGKGSDMDVDDPEEAVTVAAVEGKRMTRGKSARKKVVDSHVVEKVAEEESDVDNCKEVQDEGVVPKKRTARGRGRKKNTDSKGVDDVGACVLGDNMPVKVLECERIDIKQPCEGPLMDDDDQQKKVEENAIGEVLEVEVSDQAGVSLCVREQQPLAERLVDNVNGIENQRLSRSLGIKNAVSNCLDSVRDVEDKMNMDVPVQEVSEQVIDAREKPCEEPLDDTFQGDTLTHSNVFEREGDSVCLKEQPCSEPMDKTAQQNVLINAINDDALEVEVPAQIGNSSCTSEQRCEGQMDGSVQQYDGAVGTSYVKEVSCDKLETDSALDDQQMEVFEAGSREQPYAEQMGDTFQRDDGVVGTAQVKEGLCDESETDEQMEESEEISKASEATHSGHKSNREASDVPDLEKMTLGEWFDYLEVYLPKQIYTATDEIIDDMRKRAKQFDEFLLKQQKEDQLPRVS